MARTYRELEAWQLATELRRGVLKLVAKPPTSRNLKFCDQIVDSSSSPARNIAEGFGRFGPTEFARFLDIARGSLDETDNHLRDGVERSYFPPETAGQLIRLAARCKAAIEQLQAYLRKPSTRKRFRRKKLPTEPP
jgi:four helix bundle protein